MTRLTPPQIRLLGTLAFGLALLLAAQLSGLREHFNVAYVREAFLEHKLTGVLVFVLIFSVGNLLHLPGLLFLAAAVLALGKVWGGLVTYAAANVSCLVTFAVFRLLGGNVLTQLKSRSAQKLMRSLHLRPLQSVILLRTFFQTLPSLNIALGLSGIKTRDYVAGNLLGLPLPISFYCVFFDLLAAGLNAGMKSL